MAVFGIGIWHWFGIGLGHAYGIKILIKSQTVACEDRFSWHTSCLCSPPGYREMNVCNGSVLCGTYCICSTRLFSDYWCKNHLAGWRKVQNSLSLIHFLSCVVSIFDASKVSRLMAIYSTWGNWTRRHLGSLQNFLRGWGGFFFLVNPHPSRFSSSSSHATAKDAVARVRDFARRRVSSLRCLLRGEGGDLPRGLRASWRPWHRWSRRPSTWTLCQVTLRSRSMEVTLDKPAEEAALEFILHAF